MQITKIPLIELQVITGSDVNVEDMEYTKVEANAWNEMTHALE